MSPALPLTHLLSLLISYLENLLYMHNTNAFLYFSQKMDFPQIGFEPEPTVSNILRRKDIQKVWVRMLDAIFAHFYGLNF